MNKTIGILAHVDVGKTTFIIGGKKAIIDEELCIKCGKCETVCRFQAIENCKINSFVCEGCGTCTLPPLIGI